MSGQGVRVHVVTERDRKNLSMRYQDPVTGLLVKRTTGTSKRKEAERIAHKWEAEINEGRDQRPSKITWEDFRARYEAEVVPGLAQKTGKMIATVFNAVERIIQPRLLAGVNAARISAFQATLREQQRSEATIRSYLAHLKAALGWAVDVGMLSAMPKIPRLKRAKTSKVMKGRPITTEELERMLAKVPDTFTEKRHKRRQAPKPPAPEVVESWRYLLRGLWWSGLRLDEALNLYWDRADKLCVDLSGKRPMLRIPAELEKGNQDRLLPMAPEFAEFLLATPEDERRGRVFKLVGGRGKTGPMGMEYVSAVISAIGKAARVKVDTKTKIDPKTKAPEKVVKYASAHDLRRSFGERWAPRVMPQVLMELMRHEDISTTLRFYVGRNAQTTADVLWAAYESKSPQEGTISGTIGEKPAKSGSPRNDASP